MDNEKQMEQKSSMPTTTLIISCPDQAGLVASVTQFIQQHQGNILHLSQHVDREENIFFMRVEWELEKFTLPRAEISKKIQPLMDRYKMTWRLYFSDKIPRMAIFCTKTTHCLYDILSRQSVGDLSIEIPLIISNHEYLRPVAERFDIAFHHFPMTQETKREQEKKQLALLQKHHIDTVILARYMQIVSPDFIQHYPNAIINIHHAFLPAFPGARPYHSAYQRGVKIIGATSHYVTAELDAGPIIEQEVARVSHKNSVPELIEKGKDLEKITLSRAISLHAQRRTLVYNNKTVIF